MAYNSRDADGRSDRKDKCALPVPPKYSLTPSCSWDFSGYSAYSTPMSFSGRGASSSFGGGGSRGNITSSLTRPDWALVLPTLPKFEKNFYVENPAVRARSRVRLQSFFVFRPDSS